MNITESFSQVFLFYKLALRGLKKENGLQLLHCGLVTELGRVVSKLVLPPLPTQLFKLNRSFYFIFPALNQV